MDPNECLRLARQALRDGRDTDAAAHFEDLDEWLTKGGFAPSAWTWAQECQQRAHRLRGALIDAGILPATVEAIETGSAPRIVPL